MAKPRRNLNGDGCTYMQEQIDKKTGKKKKIYRYKVTTDLLDSAGKKIIKYFSSVKSYADAKKKYKDWLEKNSNQLILPDDNSNNTTTALFLWWLENIQKISLKQSVYGNKVKIFNTRIKEQIGHYRLNQLTSYIIQEEIINPLIQDNLSLSYMKQVKTVLKQFLEYYGFQSVIGEIKLPSKSNVKSTKKIAYWEDKKEIKKFKNACLAIDLNTKKPIYVMGPVFIFLLNTGLRIGEMMAVQWSDINWQEKTVTINKTIKEVLNTQNEGDTNYINKLFPYTKTNSGNRILPLNEVAIDSLRKIKSNRFFGDDSFIMATSNHQLPRYGNVRRTFVAIEQRAGVSHVGLHGLRHTFATQLIGKNIDIKTVSSLLGHSTMDITMKTYIHVIEGNKIAAVNLVSI